MQIVSHCMGAFPKVDTTLLCAEKPDRRVSRASCQLFPILGYGAVVPFNLMANLKSFLWIAGIGKIGRVCGNTCKTQECPILSRSILYSYFVFEIGGEEKGQWLRPAGSAIALATSASLLSPIPPCIADITCKSLLHLSLRSHLKVMLHCQLNWIEPKDELSLLSWLPQFLKNRSHWWWGR